MHSTFKLLAMAGQQNRWTKTPSFFPESLSFHLYQTAQFAHCLAILENTLNEDENLDAGHIAVLALYHDAGEVISEDVNGLFKNISKNFKSKVSTCEEESNQILAKTLPEILRPEFEKIFNQKTNIDEKTKHILKAADILSAFSKIQTEILAGNQSYRRAYENTLQELNFYKKELKSVSYFMEHFTPAFSAHTEDIVGECLAPLFNSEV